MANRAIAAEAAADDTFFGHPRGLATLFFTEMWERFSYYGGRAILLLFMTDAARGGLAMSTETSAAIYGLYTFGVYAFGLIGGWIADRVVGCRYAVLYGGILIALGNYAIVIPSLWSFYLGLFLIVLGTGLLKPNVSAIVGDLYAGDKGARRDAGFSIFYMGINVGATVAPLICSPIAERIDWRLGFLAAAVGMTFGVIQYVRGFPRLHDAGLLKSESAVPERLAQARRQFAIGTGVVVALVVAAVAVSRAGIVSIGITSVAQYTGVLVTALVALYFFYVISFVCRDRVERHRVAVCALLFLGAALFWSGFEQAGSSMNLFARDFTDRTIFGFDLTVGSLQAVNPFFIIVMAPVMGAVWLWLDSRKHNLSIPVKFGFGLILMGTGFLVLAWGSSFVAQGKVGMQWLVATYFLHTIGELCLSPVGLSSMTKLAPERLVGQMMGTWFMGSALGNLIAGLVAGYIDKLPPEQLFMTVAAFVIGGGLIFIIASPIIKRMTHGIN